MLSSPNDLAVPSTLPPFLERVLAKAVYDSSAEAIRPLHSVLSALGPCQIDGFPLDLVSQLQDKLMQILKGLDVENHSANLLCLAVLAKLSSRPIAGSPSETHCLLPAKHFFAVRRASKTLDHIVLKVILICSKSCPLALCDARSSVRLSEEIVDAIDLTERRAWFAKSTAKTTKLHEKILRPDIDTELQCAALNFISTLSHGYRLPKAYSVAYESLYLTTQTIGLAPKALSFCINHSDPNPVSLTVFAVLKLACCWKSPCSETLTQVANALNFVDAIISTIPVSPSLCQALLPPTPGSELVDQLKELAVLNPIKTQSATANDSHEVCTEMLAVAQEKLFTQLKVLFLKAMLHVPHHRDAAYLIIFDSLLENAIQKPRIAVPCKHRTKHRRLLHALNVSLLEADSTPKSISISHGWKDNLVNELSRNASFHYDSIVRMVGGICRDLELRCDKVERPLKEEQTKNQDLEERLTIAEGKIPQFDEELRRREMALNDMKFENERLLKQLQAAEGQAQGLSTSLEKMRKEFERARDEVDQAAEAAAKSSREQDLAYMSTLRSKDEMYEQQALHLESAEKRIMHLERELDEAKGQELERSQTLKEKEAVICKLQTLVAVADIGMDAKQRDIEALKQTKEKLLVEKERFSSVAAEAAERSAEVISTLQSDIRLAKDQLSSVQNAFDAFASAKAAETAEVKDSHKLLVTGLQKEIQDTNQGATMAKRDSEASINNLKKAIARLRHDRDRRSREFAEAHDLSRKLMAVVGINKHVPSPAAMIDYHIDGWHSPDDRKPRPNPSHGPSPASNESHASSENEGPTPKRMKTLIPRSFDRDDPSPKDIDIKGVKHSPFKMKRPPLAGIITNSGDWRLTTSASPHQGKGSLAPINQSSGILQSAHSDIKTVYEDDSFSGSDVFTSTDQRQLSVLQALAPQAGYDETTAEF